MNCREQNSKQCARSRNVVIRAVRRCRRSKGLHQVDKAMRSHTRKSDARQIERVNPDVVQKRVSTRMASRKRAVKLSVVGDYLRIAGKLDKPCECLIRRRCVRYIFIMDVRQMSDIIGNRFPRIDERHIPINDLTMLHARRGNLRKLVMVKGETRGFGVDYDDVLIKVAKVSPFGQVR